MATQIGGFSMPEEMMSRLRGEAAASGLKISTIIRQALLARWEAQEAKAA